jgi:N6-adenosine-specific RNA methylase IME4
MIKNQFSRRNLPLHKRLDLAFIDEELEQQQAKQRQLSTLKQFQLADDECTTDRSPVTERQDQETGKTLECVAKKAECSYGTAFQYKKIKEAGLAERVVNGESIKKVYDDLRREKARAELKQSLESIEAQEAKSLAGVYDVIVIDPPWDIKKIERDVAPEQVDLDYPTMSLDEIKALDIPCAEDCHVFLWTTQKFLRPSFDILEAWGLTYVCLFTWLKNGGFQPFNMPQFNTEFVLYAHKGNPNFIDLKQFNCGFQADRGRHSEKPEAFYDVIRRVTGGRRLDMFNRRRIDGFDGWGKEAV